MEFRLLGPLEVCNNGQPIVLAGPKVRAILTILLLDANQVVPRSRLLADVWGSRRPGASTAWMYTSRVCARPWPRAARAMR
jgi:DNA-binding SARP family transcriptional activator